MPIVGELWKDVPGYEGLYQASTEGRILSHGRWVKGCYGSRQWRPERISNGSPDKDGYLRVTLHKEGVGNEYKVHRIILTTFVGPCPESMEGCHRNGVPANNKLSNLRWGTKLSNELDKLLHGTKLSGENHPQAKLETSGAIAIRHLYATGQLTMEQIGGQFGLSKSTVCKIVHNKRYQEHQLCKRS